MNYFALTIGPIYRSLSKARKTRELWGISYLFSYVMREIIHSLIDKKIIEASAILMPFRNAYNSHEQKGAGLYPDRLIFALENDQVASIQARVQELAAAVIDELGNKINADAAVILKKHLQLYSIVIDIEASRNIILTINQHLDSIERQNRIVQPWPDDYSLTDFSDDANGKAFLKDAFRKGADGRFFFRSIPEISTIDFRQPKAIKEAVPAHIWQEEFASVQSNLLTAYKTNRKRSREEKTEDDFLANLKNHSLFGKHFRFYHKYFCIVHADGDAIGETLKNIGAEPEKIRKLSAALFNYSIAALDKIKAYGGTTVYAGGDDLLFFAPVVVNDGLQSRNIFQLVDDIDHVFREMITMKQEELDLAQTLPTLSFGIAISFYKYPLAEALERSRDLLFGTAKKVPGKNAVAFEVLKHSGQSFGTTFIKNKESYQKYLPLLLARHLDNTFLSSVQYKIIVNEALLIAVLSENNATIRSAMMHNFFENTFNESVHSETRIFLNTVRDYLLTAFDECMVSTDDEIQTTLKQVFATLRFVQFINQENG